MTPWIGATQLPKPINGVIVKLRLSEIVGAESDLQNRHGRRTVLYDNRRLGSGWQQHADRVRGSDDLRDCQTEVDIRLEIDFLHRNAVHRLGFDVLDAADVGADRVLAIGGTALLHLGRVETGELPDH